MSLCVRVMVLAASAASACGVAEAPPRAPGDPAEPVHGYFAAVATADCERLQASLTGEALARMTASGCRAVLAEHAEHGTQMRGIEKIQVDGRDPDRRLVTVRMRMGDAEQVVVIGVRQQDAGWRIDQI